MQRDRRQRAERARPPAAAARGAAPSHLLALQRSAGNAAVARAVAGRPLIQRWVVDFQATIDRRDPPATDVKNELKKRKALLKQTAKQIDQSVDAAMVNPVKTTRDVPTQVVAVLTPGVTKHAKRTQKSANVGHMGRDEFYIRTGIGEVFEGGHVIPHELFDETDDDADKAGDYVNLVPMSRTVNMSSWRKKEKKISDRLDALTAGDELKVTIDLDSSTYEMTLGQLADRFGLTVKKATDRDESVTLYEWIPRTIGPVQTENLSTGSESEYSEVDEGPLRKPRKRLKTGLEALAVLAELGYDFDPALEKKISKV